MKKSEFSTFIRIQLLLIISLIICFVMITGYMIHEAHSEEYLGNLSINPYAPNSTSNHYTGGNKYKRSGVANPHSKYGNPYSNSSINNPYATRAPKLYNKKGEFRGNLSTNRYDPNSICNPYGKYGSKYSSKSINNPYGAGSKFKSDSPNNPYGTGWKIIGE